MHSEADSGNKRAQFELFQRLKTNHYQQRHDAIHQIHFGKTVTEASKQNLRRYRDLLGHPESVLADDKLTIPEELLAEYWPQDLLPAEKRIYRELLNAKLAHATNSAEEILESGYLSSTNTLFMRSPERNTRTMGGTGKRHMVFWSLSRNGLSPTKTHETQKDIISINLNDIAVDDPLFQQLWRAPDTEYYKTRSIIPPFIVGNTIIQCEYHEDHTRTIIIKRDDQEIRWNLPYMDEVFAGHDVVNGMALFYIILLRLLGGENNPEIARIYQAFSTDGNPQEQHALINLYYEIFFCFYNVLETKITGEVSLAGKAQVQPNTHQSTRYLDEEMEEQLNHLITLDSIAQARDYLANLTDEQQQVFTHSHSDQLLEKTIEEIDSKEQCWEWLQLLAEHGMLIHSTECFKKLIKNTSQIEKCLFLFKKLLETPFQTQTMRDLNIDVHQLIDLRARGNDGYDDNEIIFAALDYTSSREFMDIIQQKCQGYTRIGARCYLFVLQQTMPNMQALSFLQSISVPETDENVSMDLLIEILSSLNFRDLGDVLSGEYFSEAVVKAYLKLMISRDTLMPFVDYEQILQEHYPNLTMEALHAEVSDEQSRAEHVEEAYAHLNRNNVAIAAITPSSKVLMVYGETDARKRLSMPGGAIDLGEDPVTAGLRELKEETGVDVTTVDRGQLNISLEEFKPGQHGKCYYVAVHLPEEPLAVANDDAIALQAVPIEAFSHPERYQDPKTQQTYLSEGRHKHWLLRDSNAVFIKSISEDSLASTRDQVQKLLTLENADYSYYFEIAKKFESASEEEKHQLREDFIEALQRKVSIEDEYPYRKGNVPLELALHKEYALLEQWLAYAPAELVFAEDILTNEILEALNDEREISIHERSRKGKYSTVLNVLYLQYKLAVNREDLEEAQQIERLLTTLVSSEKYQQTVEADDRFENRFNTGFKDEPFIAEILQSRGASPAAS